MSRGLLTLALAWFVAFGVALGAEAQKKEKPKRTPEQVFKKLDANGDGTLCVAELMGKRKTAEAEQRAKARIARKDKNGDGKLSLKEFVAKPQKPKKERPKKKGGKKGGEKSCQRKPAEKPREKKPAEK